MEKIQFDSGIRSYKFGNGVLRFNPSDPNLYGRFMEAGEKIGGIHKTIAAQATATEDSGQGAVQLLQAADREMKQLLSWVFGGENDFDALLGGVNLLAVGTNGQRVVTNLFSALEPVLLAGAQDCAREQVAQAVAAAKRRRQAQ